MRMFQTIGLAAVLAVAPVVAAPSLAADIKAGDLVIGQPWARATPGGAEVGGGYLTVANHGSTPDTLVGGSLDAAGRFELHSMTMDDGVMKMRPTGPLAIAPGATLTLSPAGTHIMFTQLKRGLKKGDAVKGTLVFEHAGTVPVTFEVEGIAAKGPTGAIGSGQKGQSMPGMDMD